MIVCDYYSMTCYDVFMINIWCYLMTFRNVLIEDVYDYDDMWICLLLSMIMMAYIANMNWWLTMYLDIIVELYGA
jgi:hypothetical protein